MSNLRKKITQHIKAYKLDVSQTNRDGSFLCPNCGVRISPDDHSENTYEIYDTEVKDNDLEEVVLYCKRCLSFIHLCGFGAVAKKSQSINAGEATKKETPLYIIHI
jgi:predicted RNA-binding Zn-ribbon protein involved in translation (DUF1610 family)